jgi:hypothetical protein
MKVPKAKHKGLTRQRLSNLNGVKDVKIGRASVDAREQGNAHVTGQGVDRDDSGFSDVEERRKKFGFLY